MPGLPPHNEIGIHVRKIEFFRHVLLLKVVELERRHEPERKAGLLFKYSFRHITFLSLSLRGVSAGL